MEYKIDKSFFIQQIDEKIVVFDTKELVYFTFNGTASYIFKKIKAGENENKIVDLVAKRYQIRPEKAKKDLTDLLVELKKKKIISPSK